MQVGRLSWGSSLCATRTSMRLAGFTVGRAGTGKNTLLAELDDESERETRGDPCGCSVSASARYIDPPPCCACVSGAAALTRVNARRSSSSTPSTRKCAMRKRCTSDQRTTRACRVRLTCAIDVLRRQTRRAILRATQHSRDRDGAECRRGLQDRPAEVREGLVEARGGRRRSALDRRGFTLAVVGRRSS